MPPSDSASTTHHPMPSGKTLPLSPHRFYNLSETDGDSPSSSPAVTAHHSSTEPSEEAPRHSTSSDRLPTCTPSTATTTTGYTHSSVNSSASVSSPADKSSGNTAHSRTRSGSISRCQGDTETSSSKSESNENVRHLCFAAARRVLAQARRGREAGHCRAHHHAAPHRPPARHPTHAR